MDSIAPSIARCRPSRESISNRRRRAILVDLLSRVASPCRAPPGNYIKPNMIRMGAAASAASLGEILLQYRARISSSRATIARRASTAVSSPDFPARSCPNITGLQHEGWAGPLAA